MQHSTHFVLPLNCWLLAPWLCLNIVFVFWGPWEKYHPLSSTKLTYKTTLCYFCSHVFAQSDKIQLKNYLIAVWMVQVYWLTMTWIELYIELLVLLQNYVKHFLGNEICLGFSISTDESGCCVTLWTLQSAWSFNPKARYATVAHYLARFRIRCIIVAYVEKYDGKFEGSWEIFSIIFETFAPGCWL